MHMAFFTQKPLRIGLLALGVGALLWALVGAAGPGHVEVVKPARGPAVQAVYATGTVEATVMMPIAPRIGARLMALNVDEGAEIAKGDVLAELESDDLKASLNELKARESYAFKEYQRYAKLVRTSAASKATYERAHADWESAKAAVTKATAELSYTQLIAPADGRIIRRDGEIGQLIPANEPVFWLSCCAPLRISAEVDEEDISLVQPGYRVLIRADAFPGKTYHGTVQNITPKGDPVARSYRVRIGFLESTPLLIGMTAETNIISRETENALLLPASAVFENQVWQVKDGTLHRKPVELGAKGTEHVEIINGISEKDVVVREAQSATLKEGEEIKPKMVEQNL
jgi:membrane fusion protein, multidrug efflux system